MATPREEMEEIQEFVPDRRDVLDTEDGGAIVAVDEEQRAKVQDEEDFYRNLVGEIDRVLLDDIAAKLLEEIHRDQKARERREKEYAEAIRRTGLGKEAPGGADFDGASKAVHPILMEASVDFAARAIRELLPPNGPVKVFVPGKDPDAKRIEKAERKKEYMNWQFLVQMPEFRSELDQLLPQLALGGSQYMRVTPDMSRKGSRPIPQFLAVDEVSIPYSATSFYTAQRQTYHEKITRMEFEARVDSGMYVYNEPITNPQLPEQTEPERATDKVEGKSPVDFYNEDGLRLVHECSTWIDFRVEDDDGERYPYLISIDEASGKIVSVVRNWEEGDKHFERMQWIVEFQFVPWRGAFSVGLGQMIGSLAGAATGILRALIDSGLVNNMPTMLRLKGANFSGQSKEFSVAGVTEIDGGAPGQDADIRKLVMALPFNEPSVVLFNLLGFCVDSAKGVVRTTFENLAEENKNLPVGTTLAMIEEGMKVASAIHLRLYHAMTNVIRILHRINKMYLTDEEVADDTGQMLAYRSDFEDPVDCVPTADPEIFSDVQRMAQLQIVQQRADLRPDLYNARAVERRMLERTKIPNAEELLLPENTPEWMNAANENAAMTLSRPVAAFPEQDHLAHIEAHVAFLMSPQLGQLPIVAPTFVPAVLEHLKEHVALWYVSQFADRLKTELAEVAQIEDPQEQDEAVRSVMAQRDPQTRSELDRLISDMSEDVIAEGESTLRELPQIIQFAIQIAQQYQQQPQMPVDPNKMAELQFREADSQRRERESQAKLEQRREEVAAKTETELAKMSAEERRTALVEAEVTAREAAERAARIREILAQEKAESERQAAQLEVDERINTADNATAMRIALAELENDEGSKSNLSTGRGINPNPSGR